MIWKTRKDTDEGKSEDILTKLKRIKWTIQLLRQSEMKVYAWMGRKHNFLPDVQGYRGSSYRGKS